MTRDTEQKFADLNQPPLWSGINAYRSDPLLVDATDAMPKGALELVSDYGAVGFGGACPPPGEVHRYIFTVHALKTDKLDIPANASNALAGYMINANALAKASITAVFKR